VRQLSNLGDELDALLAAVETVSTGSRVPSGNDS
jgi:hypothetical protein